MVGEILIAITLYYLNLAKGQGIFGSSVTGRPNRIPSWTHQDTLTLVYTAQGTDVIWIPYACKWTPWEEVGASWLPLAKQNAPSFSIVREAFTPA